MFRVLFAFVGAMAVGLVVLIAHVAGFLLVWACAIAAALCWIVAAFCFAVWLLTGAEGGLLKASVLFAYGLVSFSAMLATMAAQAWAEDLPDRIGAARGKRRRLEAAGREMQRRLPAGARPGRRRRALQPVTAPRPGPLPGRRHGHVARRM